MPTADCKGTASGPPLREGPQVASLRKGPAVARSGCLLRGGAALGIDRGSKSRAVQPRPNRRDT